MKSMRYRAAAVACALALMLAAVTCTSPTTDRPAGPAPVRIGAILPLTGPTAYLGEDERVGIELALAGRQSNNPAIEVAFEDSQGKADVALSAMRKQLDVDGRSLFMVTTTTPVLATLPAFKQSGRDVLVLSQCMVPDVTKGYPFAYRIYATSDEETDLTAGYAREKGFRRFAALHIANRFGEEGVNFFTRKAEAFGGRVLLRESFQFSDTDFRTTLAKIKALNPDAVVMYGYSTNFPLIFRQMEEMGMSVPVLGNADLALGGLQGKISPAVLDRVVFPAPHYYVAQDDPQVIDFNQKVRARGKEPNFDIGYSYDSTNMLIRAIEAAGSGDPRAVGEKLRALSPYKGVTGTIRFNEDRDTRADMSLVKWGPKGIEVVWQQPR